MNDIFLISIKEQIFILPVQFIAEFSIESGRDKTDLSVDVVPQIHEFGQTEKFCFSYNSGNSEEFSYSTFGWFVSGSNIFK